MSVAFENVGKHPMTMQGLKQATTDITTVNQWWADHSYANIGIRTGRRPEGAGIVVLDVDAKHGGMESLRRLEAEHGKLPETPTVATGGGGYHYLFEHPGVEVSNRQNMLAGLDVRGDGGYIVASPSSHISGPQYLWLPDHGPDQLRPAPMPAWLLEMMLDGSSAAVDALPAETGNAVQPVYRPIRHYSDSPAVQNVLMSLDKVTKPGSGWTARCPAHDDRHPSLSISEGDDGRILLHCHAGCTVPDIVEAFGLVMSDLFPPQHAVDYDREYELADEPVVLPNARRWDEWDTGVSFLEEDLGSHTQHWVYQDAEGRDVGVVVRWDGDDGKTFRPLHLAHGGWMVGAMPDPHPLYRLPSFAQADRVYVCEGEKATDAACAVGLVATTSCGGAKAAAKSDWSPLAGKEVVLVPDNDDAGEAYVEDVMALLLRLDPAPTVKVVRLPELPEHGDMVDYLELRGGDAEAVRAAVESLADQADAETPHTEKPKRLAYQPFPVKALPMRLAKFVARVAKALGCDASYVALPLLAALAAAIGNCRAIRLKRGWVEPSIVWAAIVGDSGTLKSPALDKALRPARERQRDAMRAFEQASIRYKQELLVYERDLKDWKLGDETCAVLPVEPQVPVPERYVVEDITVEALAALLQDQPRGLLLVRDELSGWLSGFDRYAQGKGGDAAKWLEMHGAKPLTVDRKTGPTKLIYVHRAAVSLTGGIQPGTLRRAMGDEYVENGLAARLLFAMPPRRPKRWTDAGVDPADEQDLQRLFDKLYNLRMDTDERGEPTPKVLDLTPEAHKLWVAFYDEHADEQFRLGGALASAWSKLEAYAARFALIIHLVRCQDYGLHQPDHGKVDEVSIRAGITLARWFGHEARRVYGRLKETEGERGLRDRVDQVRSLGCAVTVRDWQNLRGLKSAKEAEAQLGALQDAGYGVLEIRPQHGPGRPSKVFKLTAEFIDNIDFDKTLSGDAAAGVLSESILSKAHGVGSDAEVNGLSAAPACVDPLDKTPHSSELSGVLSKNILSINSTTGSQRPPDPACEAASS